MKLPKSFPLQVTLLTLITGILTATVFTLSSYNFLRSTQAAVSIADDLLAQINEKAIIEIDALFSPVVDIGQRATELPDLADKPVLLAHPETWYLVDTLANHPYVYSVFMGYADDDFYQIISMPPEEDALRQKLRGNKNARYALRRIMRREDGRRVEIWRFLDTHLNTVGSRFSERVSFLPTARPWYQKAATTDALVRTAPYPFFSSGSLGLTVAHRFDGPTPGVFGIDLTLDSLSRFLAEQKIGDSGVAFLFTESGAVLAHPSLPQTLAPPAPVPGRNTAQKENPDASLVRAVFRQFQHAGNASGPIRFSLAGTDYIGRISSVPEKYMDEGHMAVVAPVHDFTADIQSLRDESMMFTLLVMLVTLPLIIFVSRRITAKLYKLSLEANRIREFDLSGTVDIKSHITEIRALSVAVGSMKSSLRTFGQYMPRSLVAKVVTGELSPELGGTRQDLTIMFTDIANFTAISESMKPEELMHHVSIYFQEIGSVILENDGTIDKFIGDAVMAFWNAPVRTPKHARCACLAALKAAKASNRLNTRWREQGKPEFFTRFGLHTGNCIIGNVGSSDRMDYTAMGDAVNVASRLEGLNRHFHTQILTSETLREQAGDEFVFRPAGRVIPKGKTMPTNIYELVGLTHEVDTGRIKEWELAYEAFINRRFQEAADAFERLCREHPGDSLERLYLEKARHFTTTPPPDDWAEFISTK